MDKVIVNAAKAALTVLCSSIAAKLISGVDDQTIIFLYSPLFLLSWLFYEWLDNLTWFRKKEVKKVETD